MPTIRTIWVSDAARWQAINARLEAMWPTDEMGPRDYLTYRDYNPVRLWQNLNLQLKIIADSKDIGFEDMRYIYTSDALRWRTLERTLAAVEAGNPSPVQPGWVPPNASMALEFDRGQYWVNGAVASFNALRFVRDSAAWAFSLGYGKGVPTKQPNKNEGSIAADGLLLRTEVASQSLATPNNINSWANSGSPVITATGLFYAGIQGYSIGSTTATYRKYKAIGGWTGGATKYYIVLYKPGSANFLRINMRDDANAASTFIEGPPGALATNGQGAGTVANIVDTVIPDTGGVRMVTFAFTPALTSNQSNIGIGSASATGQDVIAFGANRWDQPGQEFAPELVTGRAKEGIAPPLNTGTYDMLVLNSEGVYEWRDDVAWQHDYLWSFSDTWDFAGVETFYTSLLPISGRNRILAAYAWPAGLTDPQKLALQGALLR